MTVGMLAAFLTNAKIRMYERNLQFPWFAHSLPLCFVHSL